MIVLMVAEVIMVVLVHAVLATGRLHRICGESKNVVFETVLGMCCVVAGTGWLVEKVDCCALLVWSGMSRVGCCVVFLPRLYGDGRITGCEMLYFAALYTVGYIYCALLTPHYTLQPILHH